MQPHRFFCSPTDILSYGYFTYELQIFAKEKDKTMLVLCLLSILNYCAFF